MLFTVKIAKWKNLAQIRETFGHSDHVICQTQSNCHRFQHHKRFPPHRCDSLQPEGDRQGLPLAPGDKPDLPLDNSSLCEPFKKPSSFMKSRTSSKMERQSTGHPSDCAAHIGHTRATFNRVVRHRAHIEPRCSNRSCFKPPYLGHFFLVQS